MSDLRVDPDREKFDDSTGVYVRAVNHEGRWVSTDFITLDRASFIQFVTSRGPVSDFAMSIFFGMFDYPREEPEPEEDPDLFRKNQL